MDTFHKEDDVPAAYEKAEKPGKFFTVNDKKFINYNFGTFKYGEHFSTVFTNKFGDKFTWAQEKFEK
jgi:hypothetical protein